jgi:hypothetical protein
MMKDLAGVTAETRIDWARTCATDVPVAYRDAARAWEMLGWAPSTPWRQTLLDVLGDWRRRITTGSETF